MKRTLAKCVFLLSICCLVNTISAQEAERALAFNNLQKYNLQTKEAKEKEKTEAIKKFRDFYRDTPYRKHEIKTTLTLKECIDKIGDNGQFVDLIDVEKSFHAEDAFQKGNGDKQNDVGLFLVEAYGRIWKIAEGVRSKEIKVKDALTDRYNKAILHYGNLEISRSNKVHRFHPSCFALPTSAVNIYFSFLPQMDEVENGKSKDKQLGEVNKMLKAIALQSWTQPLRNDFTDENVVQIERFRNHVWWVGGNALAYRSLLPTAFALKSIPMVDLLSEVCQKAISAVSQNTYNTAFWTEGFTVDGAGWGHGMQSLIWGYPIDGTNNALSMMSSLKGSPWAKSMSDENRYWLMNFFRGGNWYYYNGFKPLNTDRNTMAYYGGERKNIQYYNMLNSLVRDWGDSFTKEELDELKQLQKEAKKKQINMENYPLGQYSGTRWFFNNDDLVKRNKDYYVFVNMASNRCDGLESAVSFADEYNFFNNDGGTFFMKKGDEYHKVIGAWDITAYPGVTAREGMDKITPVTNWRGYCSKHNFAGAATNGGDNAVAGFIYEKMNASTKEGVNDKGTAKDKNPSIYGVLAYKSWFMYQDYFIALGAGITNLQPEQAGSIRTTIDQTSVDFLEDLKVIKDGKVVTMDVEQGRQSFVQDGKPVWMQQKDGFAYTILPEYVKDSYFVYEKDVPNEWGRRNKSNIKNLAKLPPKTNILRAWIDHGRQPVNGTYGYVVYCGNKQPDAELPFVVLRNDKRIQAIQSSDEKVIEAVFYKSSDILEGQNLKLSVSAPAVILIEDVGTEYKISVNDPQMNVELKQITLTFNDRTIAVDLPQNELGGKPATITIKK